MTPLPRLQRGHRVTILRADLDVKGREHIAPLPRPLLALAPYTPELFLYEGREPRGPIHWAFKGPQDLIPRVVLFLLGEEGAWAPSPSLKRPTTPSPGPIKKY